jgi:hypothetical protein
MRPGFGGVTMAEVEEIIVKVRHRGKTVVVQRLRLNIGLMSTSEIIAAVPTYEIVVDGVVRHPGCDPEAVMRALGTYLHDDS